MEGEEEWEKFVTMLLFLLPFLRHVERMRFRERKRELK